MNKKEVGAALRRGILAGGVAGCVAGWASFVAQGNVPTVDVRASLNSTGPDVLLPPIPDAPKLSPLPNVADVTVRTPTFQSLPALPALSTATKTTTRVS